MDTGGMTAPQADHVVPGVAEFTRGENAIVGSLYMICGMGGVATNALLLVVLLKDKRLFEDSSAWLHVMLTIFNILVVLPSPLPASSHFSGKWLYGDFMCQFYSFEGMVVGMSAIGAVIALCVERYVVSTRKGQNLSTFYYVCTVLNVGNALFWAVMPILGWSRYSRDSTGAACCIDYVHVDEGYVSYMIMLFIFSFILPIILALYCLIKSLPDDATSAQLRTSASAGTSSASGGHEATLSSSSSGLPPISESQLRWLCLSQLVLVMVGWGPFAALCMWALVGDTAGASLLSAILPPLASKACTTLYPLVYAVASPRLRAGYLALLPGASVAHGKDE